MKDILLPRASQPANGDASNDNALFIPAELRPVLSRFPPPDVSDRPKPSKPCTLYQPNENPEISLVSRAAFVNDSGVITNNATKDIDIATAT